MGSCWSDGSGRSGGMVGVGGNTSSSTAAAAGGYASPNDAVDHYLKSRGFDGLFSQIELSFSASNLRDRDVTSKSDAMVVVYTKVRDGTLVESFRSEVVLNSLNPKWIKKLTIRYQFEVVQTLLFRVYDIDTQFQNSKEEMLKLDEQQFLGEATCTLSEVITKPNRTVALELTRKEGVVAAQTQSQNNGKLIIHAEESLASKTTTEIVFRCLDLESMDNFSKSDPFLVISKIVEHGAPVPVSKTEVLKNEPNPVWKPVSLSVQQVGSKDTPLVIECLDFNGNGNHNLIGKVQKSLEDLEKLHLSGQGINLVLPTGVGHKHEDRALKSQLFVDKFTETVQHTFLEYLAAGFELNFMVAIDFTASNGNPRLPDSLHYIDPTGRLNAYQRAIVEVGEVLQFYDTDKRFPAWGFGARPIDIPVSHCFNLNGSSTYCEVDGIQGIMNAYNGALFNVSFAGPTLFGPVINAAATIASESLAQNAKRYYVLLIITDGVITDLQETKDALVSASDLPLSILIVGVGGADYKEMEVLDGDKGEKLESSSGRVASRDIVQFVALRDMQYGEVSVVEALLAELPSQFLTYMRNRNITPTSTTTTTSAS
ncbi:Protein BONZAI 2 [Hirschfeldia incana]|nr:Protein BONZAI 2 [Hirschfeldia incana]